MHILRTFILVVGVASIALPAAAAGPAKLERSSRAEILIATQQPQFCIAQDRCSLDVPVRADALYRYDAKMDAVAGR